MTKQEFLEELTAVLNEDPEKITPERKMESLEGWDSTGMLGVVSLLDGVLGAALDVDRLRECKTVRDIMGLVEDKLT